MGRLYFNDGSYWVMGCMSAGTEMDAGSMYPTIIEDTNGNQVFLRYGPGQGTTWRDSSARIVQIEDVRAVQSYDGVYRSYDLVYDNGPVLPHLVNIMSAIARPSRIRSGWAACRRYLVRLESRALGALISFNR